MGSGTGSVGNRRDPGSSHERHAQLRCRFERALAKEGYGRQRATDIAFHLLDWMEQLEALHRLYQHADAQSDCEILVALIDFMVHAPHHINAAKFLIGLGAPDDVFGLGFDEERRRKRAVSEQQAAGRKRKSERDRDRERALRNPSGSEELTEEKKVS